MTAKYLMDGIIGWDVDFRSLYDFFGENAEATDYWLTVNSPGGSVDEGKRIFDLIKAQNKPVTVEIYSAHSIASAIVLAADSRLIHPNGEMLIHLPWTDPGPINENDLAALQAGFAKAKEQMLDIYASNTNADREELTKIMEAEKMLSASEAIAYGFATGYAKTEETFARYDKPIFALNKNQLKKDTDMKTVDQLINKISALLETKEPKALTIALEDGKMLEVKNGTDDKPKEGHPAYIEGQGAEDGEYRAAETGIIYRIEAGKIASIEQPETIEAKDLETYILAATETLKNHFGEQITQMNADLKKAAGLIKSLSEELGKAATEIEALKEGTTSNYVPPKKETKQEELPVTDVYARYHQIMNGKKNK